MTTPHAQNATAAHQVAPHANATANAAAQHHHEDDEVPMDAAAIKAYSSVIADAAEDSEPATPVVYTETIQDEDRSSNHETLGMDPMGSMIQNEITSIKQASIKAAQEASE